VRLLAAADAMYARVAVARRPGFQAFADRVAATARDLLGDAVFGAACGAGSLLPIAATIEAARAAVDAAAPALPLAKPARTALDALTAREREVLRLLAAGSSDKEIAAALGISRTTASNHVASIRDKLRVPSRAAAAALAVRGGLV